MKKGFTLIELLAIITILGIILAIAVPNVISMLNFARNKSYDTLVDVIETSSSLFIDRHRQEIVPMLNEDGCCAIKLDDLIKEGFLESPVIDPRDNADLSLTKTVYVSKTENGVINAVFDNEIDCEYWIYRDRTIPVITMNDLTETTVYIEESYTDAGATAYDEKDGDITDHITVTSDVNTNTIGTYHVTYNVSDSAGNNATAIRTVNVISNYLASEGVNRPKLAMGMTAIKWNGTSWDNVANPNTDASWYDYINKEWANAKTADGSMWVWIPRYAYQIASGYHTNTAGTININFLKDKSNIASDNSTVDLTPTYSGSSQTNYIKHPAFTFGTTELVGIWVAKFEMSGTTSSLNSKPGISPLVYVTVGNMFTSTRNMEIRSKYGWNLASGLNVDGTFAIDTNNVDTHMMKNSEWGSVAYLSKSIYGKNDEITINNPPNCYTGGGTGDAYVTNVGQSTTGNTYGIYDMSGGTNEYVMGNYNNVAGSSELTPNSINNKYIDRYTVYDNTKYGDALYEVSSSTGGSNSWYGDSTNLINSSYPWFTRGGSYLIGQGDSGVFSTNRAVGGVGSATSWRSVVLVGAGL